jgi:hypothetical protein
MEKLSPEFHSTTEYLKWNVFSTDEKDSPFQATRVDLDRSYAVEELRGITWGLDGAELAPWQAAQRLYKAGFIVAKELAIFWSVIEAESGGYLKAWHHNVTRNADGSIFKTADGLMEVRSTDLGLIQKNVVHSPRVQLSVSGTESQAFVNDLFAANPELARGDESAEIAREMFEQRGYQPWYAFSNGSYKRSLDRGCLAVGNYLGMALVGNSNLLMRRP